MSHGTRIWTSLPLTTSKQTDVLLNQQTKQVHQSTVKQKKSPQIRFPNTDWTHFSLCCLLTGCYKPIISLSLTHRALKTNYLPSCHSPTTAGPVSQVWSVPTRDGCQRSKTDCSPLCCRVSMRGRVGAPWCGTFWKYISSSSEGYGDRECGMLPVKCRSNFFYICNK